MTSVNKFRVEAPVRSFSGESVGVTFTKGTGFVDDSTKEGRAAIEYFRRHGYGLALEAEAEPDEAPEEKVPEEPFDPAKHGVEDVQAYLDAASLDEATRVLDAEAEGKKRSTILGKRDEILAAKAPADDTKGAGA